ncbi:MAG: ERF family protein [Methanomicrobium sp.]|nr:ERF family protein [Methanomicrobium sp.]
MKKIYQELARIQKELKAPKNLYNDFGKYSYRNAEGILEAVKPLLNGLVLLLGDEIELIGSRYYVKATVTLTDGEDSISVSARAREDETKKGMDGCQITGACSSYARKYALNGLFDIDDTKDSDDPSLSPKNPKNQTQETAQKPDPKNEAPKAKVETAKTLPENPVANYIRNEICDIQEKLGEKTYDEARKKVFAYADALVTGRVVPAFDWKTITMDEAKKLFSEIRVYLPKGDEK